VIITRDAALLWTDGRYFIQAEAELDPAYWTLMREGGKIEIIFRILRVIKLLLEKEAKRFLIASF